MNFDTIVVVGALYCVWGKRHKTVVTHSLDTIKTLKQIYTKKNGAKSRRQLEETEAVAVVFPIYPFPSQFLFRLVCSARVEESRSECWSTVHLSLQKLQSKYAKRLPSPSMAALLPKNSFALMHVYSDGRNFRAVIRSSRLSVFILKFRPALRNFNWQDYVKALRLGGRITLKEKKLQPHRIL